MNNGLKIYNKDDINNAINGMAEALYGAELLTRDSRDPQVIGYRLGFRAAMRVFSAIFGINAPIYGDVFDLEILNITHSADFILPPAK